VRFYIYNLFYFNICRNPQEILFSKGRVIAVKITQKLYKTIVDLRTLGQEFVFHSITVKKSLYSCREFRLNKARKNIYFDFFKQSIFTATRAPMS
jgi:hypothetical protein